MDLRLGEVLDIGGKPDDAALILEAALERAEETGFLNAEVVRAYERLSRLQRRRGDDGATRRTIARRDAAATRLVAGGGHVRPEAPPSAPPTTAADQVTNRVTNRVTNTKETI